MANANAVVPVGPIPEPTTFADYFQALPDVYNGVYQPLLAEYTINPHVSGAALMQSVLRFPGSQVPAVWAYVGSDGLIGTIHHLHMMEVPPGRPSAWTQTIFGFVSDVLLGQIAYVTVDPADFFDNLAENNIPVEADYGAAIAALPAGEMYIGPYDDANAGVEHVYCRRAMVVPHAYVPLMFGRKLTPREAWEQVGNQVIQDGRAADCDEFLDFLRVAGTYRNPAVAGDPPGHPITRHAQPMVQPVADAELLGHIGRKLRQLLPALATHTHPLGPHFAQATNVLRQTLQEDRDIDRAERAAAADATAAATSFSNVYPAFAVHIRRLCLAGDDDEQLPQFWRLLASAKGKKAQSMAALSQLLTARANEPGSARVLPILTTQLFNQLVNFELGSIDVSVLTSGVSPFLMCPLGYHKVTAERALTTQYMVIHDNGGTPALGDVQKLISTTINLPTDLYQLANFVGAYSVTWDVLLGVDHPVSVAVRDHHAYWMMEVHRLHSIVSEQQRGPLMSGVLRAIQLEIINWVNKQLASQANLPAPSLAHVVQTIERGIYAMLPPLPATYYEPSKTYATVAATTPGALATNPAPAPVKRESTQEIAPEDAIVPEWHAAYDASGKTVQQLKALPLSQRPKTSKNQFICLAYHLRGRCYDGCRARATHRKLNDKEKQEMQRLVDGGFS